MLDAWIKKMASAIESQWVHFGMRFQFPAWKKGTIQNPANRSIRRIRPVGQYGLDHLNWRSPSSPYPAFGATDGFSCHRQPSKTNKRKPVANLVFLLIIWQIVKCTEHDRLEHHHRIPFYLSDIVFLNFLEKAIYIKKPNIPAQDLLGLANRNGTRKDWTQYSI